MNLTPLLFIHVCVRVCTAHGELPPLPHGVPRPALLDVDFGTPIGLCKEKPNTISGAANSSRTFTREWTKATVELTCGGDEEAFQASITMK